MVIEEAIVIIELGLYKVDYGRRQDIYRYCKGQDCLSLGQMTRGGGGGEGRKNIQELWLVSFPGKKGKVKRWPLNK